MSRAESPDSSSDSKNNKYPFIFRDITQETGIDFIHYNGMIGKRYICEIIGGGVALFDYDNDGDLDLYAIQGNDFENSDSNINPINTNNNHRGWRDKLYRNDLNISESGEHIVSFVDVTEESGINAQGYGMGVAVADYNNDGWNDIYVTNFGPNQLWKNNGDGTFIDVTSESGDGLDDSRWSVSSAWGDYDCDGFLDLFVVGYTTFNIAIHKECTIPSGEPDYCHPGSYNPIPDRLFRNLGDGTFEDVSAFSTISSAYGNGLGVVMADFNNDRWLDIFVTNDGMENQLWINSQNGRFEDTALFAGVSLNYDGMTEASMGVDAEDYDNDGDFDIFITHLKNETNTLYVNDGTGLFSDETLKLGLASDSLPFTSFGTTSIDYDNDRDLDIVIVNGAVNYLRDSIYDHEFDALRMEDQLFENMGNGIFKDASNIAGPTFTSKEVGRGLALGDINNDGRSDLVIHNNDGPLKILSNEKNNHNNWLGIKTRISKDGRDGLGSVVHLIFEDDTQLTRRIRGDGSYLSTSDFRIVFGLGNRSDVKLIRILWNDNSIESWPFQGINTYIELIKGTGDEENF